MRTHLIVKKNKNTIRILTVQYLSFRMAKLPFLIESRRPLLLFWYYVKWPILSFRVS